MKYLISGDITGDILEGTLVLSLLIFQFLWDRCLYSFALYVINGQWQSENKQKFKKIMEYLKIIF